MSEKAEAITVTAKILGVWATIGITSWAEASYFFATMLSLALLMQFFWRNAFRPLLERWGIIEPRKRRHYTATEWAEKMADLDK